VRIVGSVEIHRPARQVWAYVADYRNDIGWRAGVRQMRPSLPGPAEVGVTTHELLRLLGMTFRTDATIDWVEAGRLLEWRAHDRQKRLQGSRLVEATGPAASRFTEVVEGRLLGPLRPLEPLVAWLLQRQTTADLRRLKQLLEAPTVDGAAPQAAG
jgi:hypothetical protein